MERQQVTDTESQQVTESEGSGKSEVGSGKSEVDDVQEQAMEDAVRCGFFSTCFPLSTVPQGTCSARGKSTCRRDVGNLGGATSG